MKLSLRFCLPLLVLAPLVALAQPKKAAPIATKGVAPSPAPVNTGRVDITNAVDGTSTFDDAQGVARITKNVVITQSGQNLVVYAQDAVYSRPRNQANASGQLRVVTRDSTITGQKLFADFNERRFTISGNVVVTSHGKKDGMMAGLRGEAAQKPIRVLCDQVVWEYDTRQATASGNIQIVQGANRGTCNSIFYDEARNVIELRGNVHFGDNEDRTFLGQNIRIHLDQNIVSSGSRTTLSFPSLSDPGGTGKTPRPVKTPVPVPAAPTLPQDLFGDGAPPAPKLQPTATEEPIPTPIPDDPADAPETPATPPTP